MRRKGSRIIHLAAGIAEGMTVQKEREHVERYATAAIMALTGALHSDFGSTHQGSFVLRCVCHNCDHSGHPRDILIALSGRKKSGDGKITCSGCKKTRVEPVLRWYTPNDHGGYLLMSVERIRNELPMFKSRRPADIVSLHRSLYYNTLLQFGSVKRALKSFGVDYPFQEFTDARRKILPFLGELPDHIIATVSGEPVDEVAQTRRILLGIKRFRRRQVLTRAV